MSKDKRFLKKLTDSFSPANMAMSMMGQFLPQMEEKARDLNKPVDQGGMRQPGEDLVALCVIPPEAGQKIELGIMGLRIEDESMVVTRIESFGPLAELAQKFA